MAYLMIKVSGNPSFGGYLSMDKDSEVKVEDGELYELDDGHHLFELHSTSAAQRRIGQVSRWANRNSSPGILDSLSERQSAAAIGDCWEFQVIVDDNSLLVISILSKGDQIIAAPAYELVDMDEETRAACEEHIAKIKEELYIIANTPRRSGKMIGLGLFLFVFFGAMLIMGIINSGIPKEGYIAWGGMTALGFLLFILGMRKKIR